MPSVVTIETTMVMVMVLMAIVGSRVTTKLTLGLGMAIKMTTTITHSNVLSKQHIAFDQCLDFHVCRKEIKEN